MSKKKYADAPAFDLTPQDIVAIVNSLQVARILLAGMREGAALDSTGLAIGMAMLDDEQSIFRNDDDVALLIARLSSWISKAVNASGAGDVYTVPPNFHRDN